MLFVPFKPVWQGARGTISFDGSETWTITDSRFVLTNGGVIIWKRFYLHSGDALTIDQASDLHHPPTGQQFWVYTDASGRQKIAVFTLGCFFTEFATDSPTALPSRVPTASPTLTPTTVPTSFPTLVPSKSPTVAPTESPSVVPTDAPTTVPTGFPSSVPTSPPTTVPTAYPSVVPTALPSSVPTELPTSVPTLAPTELYRSIVVVGAPAHFSAQWAVDESGERNSKPCARDSARGGSIRSLSFPDWRGARGIISFDGTDTWTITDTRLAVGNFAFSNFFFIAAARP